MSISRIEQETSITFNAEEPEAMLWTCWPPMLRKMAKLGIVPYRKDGMGNAYKVPKKWVKVSKGRIGLKTGINPFKKNI